MGIFSKLSLLIRSNLNDLIARAENPEKMLEQVIMDMREQQTKAKQEVALAIAEERKLKSQVESEAKQSQEWERRAVLALQQGRDDLARQALLRQQEYAQRAQSLHETWSRQAADTEKVKDALRQLQVKIEEAQRKKNLLVAKQKRAQAQRRIHETMAGLSDTSAFETFERMAQKIEHTERLALAAAEVSEELSGDPLEKQFKALEANTGSEDIEYRLLEMKQKMGLALPPAPRLPRAARRCRARRRARWARAPRAAAARPRRPRLRRRAAGGRRRRARGAGALGLSPASAAPGPARAGTGAGRRVRRRGERPRLGRADRRPEPRRVTKVRRYGSTKVRPCLRVRSEDEPRGRQRAGPAVFLIPVYLALGTWHLALLFDTLRGGRQSAGPALFPLPTHGRTPRADRPAPYVTLRRAHRGGVRRAAARRSRPRERRP